MHGFLRQGQRWGKLCRVGLAIALSFGLTTAQPAMASYTVDPLRLEATLPQNGTVVTTSVRIQNTSAEPIRLRAYLENWTMDESGALQMVKQSGAYDIADRVRFSPKEFEIPGSGVQVLRLAISLPQDAPPGEYRGILFFEDLKTQQQRFQTNKGFGAAVEVKQRLGMAVYVYKGDPKPSPEVADFSCQVENSKLKSHIALKNAGNKHARMLGTLLLKKSDGQGKLQPFKEVPLNGLHDIIVLPNTTRMVDQVVFPGPDLDNLPSGSYQAELVLSASGKGQAAPAHGKAIQFTVP